MSRVWLITGAGRGLGFEIAKAALSAGDRVVATGRNRESLEKTFAGEGDRVLALALDVTDEAQGRSVAAAAVGHFGRIDILVNNAGYGLMGMFEEHSPEAIERQYATNVFGLMHVTRAVLPVMRKQRSGRIFNITSIGGLRGVAGWSAYCSTKFAVEGFSESLAQEVAPFGIQVTAVEPGAFRTDFLDTSSVQHSTTAIDDYARLSNEHRSTWDGRNHQQAGDPAKLATALLTIASAEQQPVHWVVGTDAVAWASDKFAAFTEELERWRKLSLSTDIEAEAAVAG
jgi:NAD(P)-dependent dehydrogenase (short-subunit alcohol dehydrogenase family)